MESQQADFRVLAGVGDDEIVTFPPLGPDVNVLMIWPRFPQSYWGLKGLYEILPEKALVPPLPLATVAAVLPAKWRVRLLDHAYEEIRDGDLLAADLVMISIMNAQQPDCFAILERCRRLGRRTIVGGPFANSDPDILAPHADHLVVGEVDAGFDVIARDLEQGRARRIYRIPEKPDVTRSPLPRFDLFDFSKYTMMPVQFSRGCPFECEFCDIITIYGRRPRTKTPSQIIAELEELRRLGWSKWVFLVDDNFVGNHRKALEMSCALARWQKERNYPFTFVTEASIDLSERAELLDAMVEANFVAVFIGIETPSPEALRETKKHQNLRRDILQQVQLIRRRGLSVSAGFIVGFDSDDESIFDRQKEFIEAARIPWAFINILQAPRTTPLYERLQRQGRLRIAEFPHPDGCRRPNFRTILPVDELLRRTAGMVRCLYEPRRYFERALRSLEDWDPRPWQRLPRISIWYGLRGFMRSLWVQGLRSDYRRFYWRFFGETLRCWWRNPAKLQMALFCNLVPAHHFINFGRQFARSLEQERDNLPREPQSLAEEGDRVVHHAADAFGRKEVRRSAYF